MLVDISKKCNICKEYVSLEKDDVIWDKAYMHFDCRIEKEYNKKNNKLSLEEIKENIRKIQKDNENHVQARLLSERFYRWIQQSYEIVVIPHNFFTKIGDVTNGKYQGLTIPIPLEDIFDMWQRKKKELDGIYASNIKKGKSMDKGLRLSYDLAVIINKYDSYLKWKNQQKAMAGEIQKELEEKSKIDFNKVNQTVTKQQTDTTSIEDILDEVF
jgi:hypothetical protein